MTDNIANALAASSLLLTVLALLYTVWSPEISAAAGTIFDTDPAAREPQRRLVRSVQRSKAVPLMIGAWLVALIFAPRAYDVLAEAWRLRLVPGSRFDDIKAALVLTEIFTGALALALAGRVRSLADTLQKSH